MKNFLDFLQLGKGELITSGPMRVRAGGGGFPISQIPSSQFGQPQPLGIGKTLGWKLDVTNPPMVWTVALSPRWSPGDVVGGYFDAVAYISFGCGGSDQTVEVNLVAGTTICAPCNGLFIRSQMVNIPNDEGPFVVPENLEMTVTLSPGTASEPAQRLYYLDIEDDATSEPFPVPPFARDVNLIPRDDDSVTALFDADNRFRFYAGSSQVGVYAGSSFSPGSWDKLSIPAYAHAATFENKSGSRLRFWVNYGVRVC